MLNKIKKIRLYYKALYKGELLKRIEYKVKDVTGYFYIRNKLQNKVQFCKFYDANFKITNTTEKIITEEKYMIFNKEYSYDEFLENLKTEKIFWRKVRLNKYEDVKVIWEFNRLQILLPLTIKYIKTHNIEYKEKIKDLLENWTKNNEFEYTLNWNSNLEVAIRAINIALCLLLLQDTELNNKYANLLYLHTKHVYNEINYSDCCIPNNHVIGEATALLMLSNILDTKETKKWNKKAKYILNKYMDIIDEEGISKENSFGYQYFVTKMYILNLCFIKEKDLFEKINEKIIKSLKILKWTIINENEILNYGDNDDGFVFSIYDKFNIAKDIKEYYNLFYNNIEDEETKIYKQIFNKFNSQNEIKVKEIDEEKGFILTKNIFIYKWDNNILFFNAKNIEGHSHNDSLAINLIIDGQEVLLDSGTYSYNKSKEDRKFFRSREAHNTIQLEGNAKQVGSFRWINRNKSYIANFKEDEEKIEIEGKIDKLASRKIVINNNNNDIEIVDKRLNQNEISLTWIMDDESFIEKNIIRSNNISIFTDKESNIEEKETYVSNKYLIKEKAKMYCIKNYKNDTIRTIIKIKENV